MCLKTSWNLHLNLKVQESQHVGQIVVFSFWGWNKTGGWQKPFCGLGRQSLWDMITVFWKGDCFYVSCLFFAVSLLFSLLEFGKDLLENSDLFPLFWRELLQRNLPMLREDLFFKKNWSIGAPGWLSCLSLWLSISAQVRISWFVGLNPGSGLHWQQGACLGFSLSLFLHPSSIHNLSLSLSLSLSHTK